MDYLAVTHWKKQLILLAFFGVNNANRPLILVNSIGTIL